MSGCFAPLAIFCPIRVSPENGEGFLTFNNPQLPWQGDYERFCNGEEQIGAPCDDGNPATENDIINEDCVCTGCTTVTNAVTEAICTGSSYELGDSVFTTAGMYSVTLQTPLGCDSIVQLQLDLLPSPVTLVDTIICPNAPIPTSRTVSTVLGCDSIIQYRVNELREVANAGEDMTVCTPDTQLDALLPSDTINGFWTTSSGTIIDATTDPKSIILELDEGANVFTWTLSHANCSNYSSDEVVITYENGSIRASDDEWVFEDSPLVVNILANDFLPNPNSVAVQILENYNQNVGTFDLNTNTGELVYEMDEANVAYGTGFQYKVAHRDCPDILFDTATVRIVLSEKEKEEVSLVFTPNDDGFNDTFIIPELFEHPEKYPDNSLNVINRWGDVVYTAKPYNNDWDGRHYRTGKLLPPGTYFYIARLSVADGIIKKEKVTLIR